MRQPLAGYIDSKDFNILESIVSLMRRYYCAFVFTIHEPHSDAVTLLRQPVFLTEGTTVYPG